MKRILLTLAAALCLPAFSAPTTPPVGTKTGPPGSDGTGLTDAANWRSLISLGNVSNTSDANKPVSTATATALAAKADLTALALKSNILSTPRIFTPQSFGATGTATTIEGGFVNQAIVAANAAGGGVVDCLGGTFFTGRVSNLGGQFTGILMMSNVTLRNGTFIAHSSLTGLSQSVIGSLYTQSNMAVEDCVVDGNKANVANGGENEGINPKSAINFRVSRCIIRNTGADGIDCDSGTDFTFEGLTVINCDGNGIYPSGWSGRVVVNNCRIEGNALGRILEAPGTSDWNAVGGVVGCYGGSGLMTVSNCYFKNNARDLTTYTSGNLEAFGNTFENSLSTNAVPVTSVLLSIPANLHNNVFLTSGVSSTAVQIISGGANIADNRFITVQYYGIKIGGAIYNSAQVGNATSEVIITRNSFPAGNFGRIQITRASSDISILNNTFVDGNQTIRNESGSVTGKIIVTGNTMAGTGAGFFYSAQTSGGMLVSGNSTSGNGEFIRIFTGTGVFSGNIAAAATLRIETGTNVISGNSMANLIVGPTNVIQQNNIATAVTYAGSGNEGNNTWLANTGTGGSPRPNNLSIAGSSATLATPRAINGVAFNGSADITLTKTPFTYSNAADLTTTSTTFVDATGLSFPVLANKNYAITLWLVTNKNDTNGMQIQTTGPASPTKIFTRQVVATSSISATALDFASAFGTASTTFNVFVGDSFAYWQNCTINNGASAGTVQIQFRAVTGGTAKIYAGSWMQVTQLN